MGRKRKIDNMININESSNSSGTSFSHHHHQNSTSLSNLQRSAANDRERTRMRVLSKAFVKLKTSLPWVPADTKLSKLDTLKLASSYISYLTQILQDDENNNMLNSDEIFQKAGVNLQKFNLSNAKLFSGTNVRFSHTDKHKKIIENLTVVGLTAPSLCVNNTFNSNNSAINTNDIKNIKIANTNNNNNFNGFNLNNYSNDYHCQSSDSTTNSINSTSSPIQSISNTPRQIYIKEELLLNNQCYPAHFDSSNIYNINYNTTYS